MMRAKCILLLETWGWRGEKIKRKIQRETPAKCQLMGS